MRRRLHYELLTCAYRGHELLGQDAGSPRPQDELFVRDRDGLRWHRCLRCDAWVPAPAPTSPAREHPPERHEVVLPLRGKALRDKIVLRLIAIDRAFHFVVLLVIAAAIFVFAAHHAALRADFYRVLGDFQGGLRSPTVPEHGFVHSLDHVLSLQTGRLHVVGAIVLAYALLEGAEAIGLWYQKRWAEYLTFIATAALLPLEIHELALRISVLKLITLTINVAVVIYLLRAKRLFGIRGGAAADLAERERDSGWPALERTAPSPLSTPPRD